MLHLTLHHDYAYCWKLDCASNSNLGMQLSPALQSPFSFHLGCGYARKKTKPPQKPSEPQVDCSLLLWLNVSVFGVSRSTTDNYMIRDHDSNQLLITVTTLHLKQWFRVVRFECKCKIQALQCLAVSLFLSYACNSHHHTSEFLHMHDSNTKIHVYTSKKALVIPAYT